MRGSSGDMWARAHFWGSEAGDSGQDHARAPRSSARATSWRTLSMMAPRLVELHRRGRRRGSARKRARQRKPRRMQRDDDGQVEAAAVERDQRERELLALSELRVQGGDESATPLELELPSLGRRGPSLVQAAERAHRRRRLAFCFLI